MGEKEPFLKAGDGREWGSSWQGRITDYKLSQGSGTNQGNKRAENHKQLRLAEDKSPRQAHLSS